MKRFLTFALFSLVLLSCEMDETCDYSEADMVSVQSASGPFRIDAYEASRGNATADTQGTGVTLACNYRNAMPWSSISYEDARNACLDAGKRLCTKEEWQAACEGTQTGCNLNGDLMAEAHASGASASCRSKVGAYDMVGNLREWVEGGFLMGGSYLDATASCATSLQSANVYGPSTEEVGFRCCEDAGL